MNPTFPLLSVPCWLFFCPPVLQPVQSRLSGILGLMTHVWALGLGLHYPHTGSGPGSGPRQTKRWAARRLDHNRRRIMARGTRRPLGSLGPNGAFKDLPQPFHMSIGIFRALLELQRPFMTSSDSILRPYCNCRGTNQPLNKDSWTFKDFVSY